MRLWFLVILSMGVLVACGTATPDPEALPTLVDFPTAFNLTEDAEGTPVAQDSSATPSATITVTHTPQFTPTAQFSATASLIPSATITETPSPSPTLLPTIAPEDRPILGLLEILMRSTVLPEDYQVPDFDGVDVTLVPTLAEGETIPSLEDLTQAAGGQDGEITPINLDCAFAPPSVFGTIYSTNPDFALQLGCPTGSPPTAIESQGALQEFERGTMLWVQAPNTITVLYKETDLYDTFPDTFVQGTDPEESAETPPAGLLAPVRGFLKIWDTNPQVRNQIGWATVAENAVPVAILNFENGTMMNIINGNRTLVIIESVGSYQWFAG